MSPETEAMIAARRRAKTEIKRLEKQRVFLSPAEVETLKEWRNVARRLDYEIGQRIVQIPLPVGSEDDRP